MSETPAMSPVEKMMAGIDLDAGLPASATLSNIVAGDVTFAVADMPATGEQRGVALLIPGFTSSRATFFPMFQQLADQGFRIVSFSQRGQPGSTGGDSPADYPLEQLGADVHELVAAMSLGESIHLVGHSFGGVVGIEAVTQNPQAFASYTMWNSGPSSLGDIMVQSQQALRAYGPHGLWVAECQMSGLDPDSALRGELDPVQAYRYTRLMQTNPAQLDAALTHLYQHHDRSDELVAAGVRTLVSHGENDDAWPIDSQRAMALELGATYEVIANAGHSAHVDQPEASAKLLATFWSADR